MGPLSVRVVSGYFGDEFWLHLVAELKKRSSPESPEAKGPLSLRQMCTRQEWKTRLIDVKWWKRLQGRESFQPKETKHFFPVAPKPLRVAVILFFYLCPHDAALRHHSSRRHLTTCSLHTPNGIVKKLVTLLTSRGCGGACSPLPLCSVSQPLLFTPCYYITQTASGHQSKAAHTQNGLIILAGRAISPVIISLTCTLCN